MKYVIKYFTFILASTVAVCLLQVAAYSSRGLSCCGVCGDVSADQDVYSDVASGNYQLVFFTPEVLLNNRRWRGFISNDIYARKLKALVIDEAHCIKKWLVHAHTHNVTSFILRHNKILQGRHLSSYSQKNWGIAQLGSCISERDGTDSNSYD